MAALEKTFGYEPDNWTHSDVESIVDKQKVKVRISAFDVIACSILAVIIGALAMWAMCKWWMYG